MCTPWACLAANFAPKSLNVNKRVMSPSEARMRFQQSLLN